MSIRPMVPAYISAATPRGLRRKCLLNNAKRRLFFEYTIVVGPDGKWYAWYMLPFDGTDFDEDKEGGEE